MSSTLPSSLSLTSRSSLSLKDTQRQRDRAGASIEGEHPTPRAQRENPSCERRHGPAEPNPKSTQPNAPSVACPQSFDPKLPSGLSLKLPQPYAACP
jgi:hypothetical protein